MSDISDERLRAKRKPAYSRDPQQLDPLTWFYEERRGLHIIREVRNGAGNYTAPTQKFYIPWPKLEASLKRHQAIKRARAKGKRT